MVTLHAHFDGKTIVPDEPLALTLNQKLRITIETIEEPPAKKPDRVAGRSSGALIRISPDFDEHLGDDFWGLK